MKAKCNKALQILRVVSHTNWGADRRVLLRLYRSLVRSKLDYGCFVYGAARKSYLKELDSIHHQGLRLVLGAFSTSPVESLYAEANEAPLSLRRQKLALQFYTKLYSCPSNSAYNCVFDPQYKVLFEHKTNAIKPFGLRMEEILEESEMDLNCIHESIISDTPPWLLKQPEILLHLTKYSKSDTNPSFFLEEYHTVKEQYPEYIHIYTDGSKIDDKTGCAAVLDDNVLQKRLPDKSSIFSAQILAVNLALDFISRE